MTIRRNRSNLGLDDRDGVERQGDGSSQRRRCRGKEGGNGRELRRRGERRALADDLRRRLTEHDAPAVRRPSGLSRGRFAFGLGGSVAPPRLNSGPPPPRPPLSSLVSGSAGGGSAGAAAPSPSALLVVRLGPVGLLARQADLALAGVDAQDLHLDLVADLDDFLGALDLVVGQLGDVQQAFQARLQLDEDAEVGELRDLALDDLARAGSGPGCRSPTGRLAICLRPRAIRLRS